MSTSTLQLGYRIRRATLETCGGLYIFPHDLGAFCIPIQYADIFADAYKRYLWASRILNYEGDPDWDEQVYECDRQSLAFFHERNNLPFEDGIFCLEAAVEFVWLETKLPKSMAIRWCMMMEYVSFEDQRLNEKRRFSAEHENEEMA